MDFNLTEKEKMIKTMARDFADRSVRPLAREIDRSGDFPRELASQMGNLGFYGLPYPQEYGGSGSGYTGYVLAIEELCRASMAVGAIVAVDSLAEESIYRFGNEEQKRDFLLPLASGKYLACYAFTEAATGSDPRAIVTRARPVAEGYVIEGEKIFSALSPAAAIALVFAKDETERVSAFIVDTLSPGFEVRHPWDMMGARGLGTSAIYLDGVRIPESNLLGEKGQGYEVLLEALSVGKLGVSAEGVGVGQEALDLSIAYANERTAYGRPISNLPTIQWLLAEMATRVDAARWLTYRTAFLRDQGENIQKDSAIAKLFCSQAAVEVTRMAMQVHGAYGYTKEMDIERLYRDAKLTEIYEGISEIQRVIIASNMVR